MKFNFSLRARQTDDRYALVRVWTTDKQWELYETLLSASLYDSFYHQTTEQLAALRKLIRDNDPVFVARLAIYFREKLQLRTLSFILTAELAGVCKDKELIGKLTGRVIRQAGEIPGWLDYYARVRAGKAGKAIQVTTAIRKHLSIHFNGLDAYRFVRLTKAQQARLRYALSLIRPKPAGKAQHALFRRILQDKLPARNAWQSEYEALQLQNYDSRELKQAAIREKWKEGISTFRMGYTTLLEKLPNILEAGVSGKVLKLAAEYLGNAAAVAGSRQSPLKFLEAYRKLQQMEQGGVTMLQEALEEAIRLSVNNWTGLDGDSHTVIFENDQVRVLAVHFKPGQVAPMHSHPANVSYFLTDGKLKITLPDGKVIERSPKAGTAGWSDATTHAAENVGTADFQQVQVELKPPVARVVPTN